MLIISFRGQSKFREIKKKTLFISKWYLLHNKGQVKLKAHPVLFSFMINLPHLKTSLYFVSFLLISTFVPRARGVVFLIYCFIWPIIKNHANGAVPPLSLEFKSDFLTSIPNLST